MHGPHMCSVETVPLVVIRFGVFFFGYTMLLVGS